MNSRETLIERLRERLAEPGRRTDLRTSRSQKFLRSATGEEVQAARQKVVELANAAMDVHRRGGSIPPDLREEALAAFRAAKTPAPRSDLAPASAQGIEHAEEHLGFGLPEALVTIYREVADGGFGPRYGLLPLKSIIEDYARLRSSDCDPQWPETLLPITNSEAEQYCIQSPGGEILRFELDRLNDDNSNLAQCFSPVAESLEEWLHAWLDREPDVDSAEVERAAIAHGTPRWFEAWVIRVRALSAEQRAKLSLEGEDWEEKLRAGMSGG
jgi:hypothetical protein